MHEYSIVQALMEKVETAALSHGATAVHRLAVRIGELSGVDPRLLDTAWRTYRGRTMCEDAELEIDVVRAEWECSGCGTEVTRGGVLACPTCGSPARLRKGDEIVLDRIEMEVA